MSSLWTPGGEHEIPREPVTSSDTPDPQPQTITDMPEFDDLTPEQQAQAQAMAEELSEARARIADTPAVEVIANHAMGLYELAAIHLSTQPPAPAEARLAIDAMTALVSAVANDLGENETVLREALQQLQLAYVQVSNAEGGVEQSEDEQP
jgi:hypothetical protein